MKIISERLRLLRIQQDKSQASIATAIGISDANYQKYEYGTRIPAAESLIKLADYFGVSVDYLLGRTDNPEINR